MSDSGGSGASGLDKETEAFVREAPPQAHIGTYLERNLPRLPKEVSDLLAERFGAGVRMSKLLKVSFHATYLLDLSPALKHDGVDVTRVIVQVVGVELGDKAVCGPVSAAVMEKAAELATQAGLRVAATYAKGQCSTPSIGPLDFIIQEFIETQTVEDEVVAPADQHRRICADIRSKLDGLPLDALDTEPLTRFQTFQVWLQWLMSQVPAWDADLQAALALFTEGVLASPPEARGPALIHQDMNGGNVLCSPASGGAWALDGLIDWESAVVADPQIWQGGEPWSTARALALVVKGSYLAHHFVSGSLPRCELGELVENYDRAAHELDEKSWLSYRPWAERVKAARSAAGGAASAASA